LTAIAIINIAGLCVSSPSSTAERSNQERRRWTSCRRRSTIFLKKVPITVYHDGGGARTMERWYGRKGGDADPQAGKPVAHLPPSFSDYHFPTSSNNAECYACHDTTQTPTFLNLEQESFLESKQGGTLHTISVCICV